MLEVTRLCAGYPGKQVLHQVDLTVHSGTLTAILGPNGCGKSTLLKALCGMIPAEGGCVTLCGEDILTLPSRKLALKMSYLTQGPQIPDMTAQRLVLHGRFPHLGYPRRYGKGDHAIVKAVMEQMGVWEHRDTMLEQLSGGERQKIYIAMALAQDTPVILLDEPTTYLDISHQLQLLQLARELTRQGKTVLMVLHDLPHAFQMADALILMEEGRIVAQGTPEQIFDSGLVDAVFRVRLCRAKTEKGWRYYCE